MKKLLEKWYLVLIGAFLVFALLVYGIVGQKSYIAIHDNLDLFVAQYQMMKNTGTFFTQGQSVPFLHGISRDGLPSELALSTLLYVFFPSFTAYVLNYILKIVIAIAGFVLLGHELFGARQENYDPLFYLTGFAYGILNVFPAFGIPFASIPLVVYIVIRICRTTQTPKLILWYAALFCYPFLSYFSYFGLFICAYLCVALLVVSLVQKKLHIRLMIAIPVISVGYVVFEYRLFRMMLFDSEVSIRSTMVGTDFTLGQCMQEVWDSFCNGIFHADAVQNKLILPLCLVYFVVLNGRYLLRKEPAKICKDLFNLVMVLLLFDSLVYGLYDFAPIRGLVETLVPPLEGWQFNRTIFFNPFLWYAALLLVVMRFYDAGEKVIRRYAANGIVLAAILLILLSGTRYNDLFLTSYNTLLKVAKNKEIDLMNYEEFYSTELFRQVKQEIGYDGEWSCAYGFHPAVLEYNGIATLDGYLGFYSQEYKDAFRQVIAPAIDRQEASRIYYDEWGARAYLYSGTEDSVVSGYKSYAIQDTDLYMDGDAFAALDGKYVFSRYELTRLDACHMEFVGQWSKEGAPYSVYVYQYAGR